MLDRMRYYHFTGWINFYTCTISYLRAHHKLQTKPYSHLNHQYSCVNPKIENFPRCISLKYIHKYNFSQFRLQPWMLLVYKAHLLGNPPSLHRGSTISKLFRGFVNGYFLDVWYRKIHTHLERGLIKSLNTIN